MLCALKINIKKRGSALVFSLIILSFLLVTALSIATTSVINKKSALSSEKANVSFQVADSGVEMVLQKVYKENPTSLDDLAGKLGSGLHCDSSDGSISFPVAQGKVKILFFQGITGDQSYTDCTSSTWLNDVNKIRSIGTYGSTVRAVDVGLKTP